MFCYSVRSEHFKGKELPKDWPSSHGRDHPTRAGSPSPDSTLAQPQWCQYLQQQQTPSDPASQQRGCNTSTTQTPSCAPHFFSVFSFPSIDDKGKTLHFYRKAECHSINLDRVIKAQSRPEISSCQKYSWYSFLKKAEEAQKNSTAWRQHRWCSGGTPTP